MQSDFTPKELAELTQRAKVQIRRRMQALRKAYPRSALTLRDQQIARRVADLSAFQEAKCVASFFPLIEKHEADLSALHQQALELGKRLAFPFLRPKGERLITGFAEVTKPAELCDQGRNFLEPPLSSPPLEPGSVDLILVPALAVSGTGHRLGYGMGYYDATLPEFCPPATSVTVAYDFQLLLEVPVEENDFATQYVVTDQRTLRAEPLSREVG